MRCCLRLCLSCRKLRPELGYLVQQRRGLLGHSLLLGLLMCLSLHALLCRHSRELCLCRGQLLLGSNQLCSHGLFCGLMLSTQPQHHTAETCHLLLLSLHRSGFPCTRMCKGLGL